MGLLSALRPQASAPGAAVPLPDAPVGRALRVEAISAENALRSDRLAALGLVVGCEVVIRQRRPAFVLDVGETTIALDKLVARGIRVRVP